jgi:hypothetical protein
VNLPDELRRQLVQAVYDLIGDPPPTPTLATLVGYEALIQAPAGMNGFRYAEWIVQYALRQPTREVFVRVFQSSDTGALVELSALVADLQADGSKWTAPLEALWIPLGWPFIDRDSLRAALTSMSNGGGPAVLSIEGPFGYGKRTMAAYIQHLGNRNGGFAAVVRELRPEPEPGALFAHVSELWTALGEVADLETTHAEPERQATTLAREVVLAAPTAPVPIWFVANVMDAAGLEDGVLKFVDELLRLLQETPSVAQKLRVLVLCDQLSLLGLQHPPPLDARHTLPEITDVEIRQWLEAAVPGKDPALYELTAQSVIESLDTTVPTPARRLRYLSRSCAVAQRRLATA